jgi:hypothetical protein
VEDVTPSLVPSLPHVLNVARRARERREPGKIYHVHDIGVEATWSAARANTDSALFDGSERTMNDRRSECTSDHFRD